MKMSFVGGGNMASALVGGLLARGADHPPEIAVIDPSATQREALRAQRSLKRSTARRSSFWP
jgi:pyrroline-5-carboxylate reductase